MKTLKKRWIVTSSEYSITDSYEKAMEKVRSLLEHSKTAYIGEVVSEHQLKKVVMSTSVIDNTESNEEHNTETSQTEFSLLEEINRHEEMKNTGKGYSLDNLPPMEDILASIRRIISEKPD